MLGESCEYCWYWCLVTWLSSKCPNKGLLHNATYPMTPLKTKQFFILFFIFQKIKELITKLLLLEAVIVIWSRLPSIYNYCLLLYNSRQ